MKDNTVETVWCTRHLHQARERIDPETSSCSVTDSAARLNINNRKKKKNVLHTLATSCWYCSSVMICDRCRPFIVGVVYTSTCTSSAARPPYHIDDLLLSCKYCTRASVGSWGSPRVQKINCWPYVVKRKTAAAAAASVRRQQRVAAAARVGCLIPELKRGSNSDFHISLFFSVVSKDLVSDSHNSQQCWGAFLHVPYLFLSWWDERQEARGVFWPQEAAESIRASSALSCSQSFHPSAFGCHVVFQASAPLRTAGTAIRQTSLTQTDAVAGSRRMFRADFTVKCSHSRRDVSPQHSKCCTCTQCHKMMYIHT